MTMTDEKPRRIVDEADYEAPAEAPVGDKVISMTESQLRNLIAEVQAQTGGLGPPPGAYRTETGEVFRRVLEPTGRTRPNPQTGADEQIDRVVEKRVYLVSDPSPEGLRNAYRSCQASGLHWYHPRLGWYRGTKRETDVPQNLGSGAEAFEMAFTPMPVEDDYGSSTVTMQGVDAAEVADAPSSPDDQPSARPRGRPRKGQ